MCVFMYVCVCVRKKDIKTDRHKDRQTQRQTDIKTDKHTDR